MELSVACTFEPGLVSRVAAFPGVREVYGKMDHDIIGGGRSSHTLRHVSRREPARTVEEVHRQGKNRGFLRRSILYF